MPTLVQGIHHNPTLWKGFSWAKAQPAKQFNDWSIESFFVSVSLELFEAVVGELSYWRFDDKNIKEDINPEHL